MTVDNIQQWTFEKARAAIDAHEKGSFAESSSLIDAMGRDDRINATMNSRQNAVLARNGDFSIAPPEEGGDEQMAKMVESWWFDVVPDECLAELTRWLFMAGVIVARIHWDRSATSWMPTYIEKWHNHNIRWDDHENKYYGQSSMGEIPIEWDDPNWLIIEATGGRPWMAGGVRALGCAYIFRQFNWKDWAKFNERHGLPIIAIKEPAEGFNKRQKDAFFASVRRMGSTGILRLPQLEGERGPYGFDVDFREAKDNAHETFEKFRENLDISIAIALLGQNLSTEVQGGSFAATRAHIDAVRADYRAADIEILRTALRKQLILRWIRYNFANYDLKRAPWPTWDQSVPIDEATVSKKYESFGRFLEFAGPSKIPFDFEAICEQLNIPLIEGAAMPKPGEIMPEPPAPAPAPKPAPAKKPAKKAAAKRVPMASGDMLPATSGFIEGQIYADDLVDASTKAGRDALAPFIDRLIEIVDQGDDYESIRAAVVREFAEIASPTELRDIIQMTLILANLAGQAAVAQGDGDDDDDGE